MKKLLITLEYPPQKGGVATYLENLVGIFPNDDIIVLAQRFKNSFLHDHQKNQSIVRENLYYTAFWPRWLKSFFYLKKFTKKNKVDHLIISHVLPLGYVALMQSLPYTVIVHGTDILMAKKTKFKKFMLSVILHHAKNIIVNSNWTGSLLKEFNVADKTILAYPCAKKMEATSDPEVLNKFKIEHGLTNKKVLLSINRFVPRKGNDKVIEALNEITNEIPDWTYLIVGLGDYGKHLRELAEKMGLSQKIKILENVADSDLPKFYQVSDMFIGAGRIEKNEDAEGFGIVFIEAAQYGKPSIAGNVGGAPEAVVDYETGILVDGQNISDIGRAIKTLLNDQELVAKLGQNAYNRATKEFTCENQFKQIKNLLS
jgi:phosphatidylinositol alpha-1,6-mannosyltransferase